jgi:S1-C subfamily serine protease
MKFRTINRGLAASLVGFILLALSTTATLALDTAATGAGVAPSDPIANSVVKILSTVHYPDYYKPWTRQEPEEISGSGVVIKGKRILTNAHVVLYAGQIQVQDSSGDLINATVESIAPGIDLAVLKLDDDSFFDLHKPVDFAQGPPGIQDPVTVYGYPEGGDNLSITKGIVSRVEFVGYNYPMEGLRVQIDAAINPGNSGGPAIVNGKIIGLAFSKLGGNAENIGYIIPCEEINLFLQKAAGGQYSKPRMYDECQPLSNPALRSYLKLDKAVQGVMVNIPVTTDGDYPLKKYDVITKIGSTPIDNDGMVNLGGDLHVFFKYFIQKDATNNTVPLTIVRNGREMQIQVPLLDRPRLIPFLDGGYPSYFVYGPLVFSGATAEFMGGYMRGMQGGTRIAIFGLTRSPLMTRMGDEPAFKGEELVVVSSPLFPDRLSRGYTDPAAEIVRSVNGIPVKNLKHLVQILRDSRDEFIRFEFCGDSAQTIVFPRAEMATETDSILTDNDIRSQGSPDVMKVWSATAVK